MAGIGTDLTRFPDADHLAAWAELAPGQNESGGQPYPDHLFGCTLPAVDQTAAEKKAKTRLAHRILLIIYQVMTMGQPYRELGPRYHDEWDRSQILTRTVRRLERLGYRVTSTAGSR